MQGSKRLQKEYGEFVSSVPAWVVDKPALQNDNLYKWRILLKGPEATPYENGKFEVELDIPGEYPFKPPKLKFLTKIYHPNVKNSDGSICTEILTDGWSPQLRIQEVLLTILTMMREPNPDNPLEAEIAQQYKTDRNAFTKVAKEWTKKHAK